MKKSTLITLLCLFFGLLAFAQERNCASMESLEKRMALDPSLQQKMVDINDYTQQKILSNQGAKVSGEIITIPVVVHVIYSNNNENISDAQVQSQIDVINEDFRRTNSDADNKWSVAADTQIEFALATIDPNGNSTNGITRKSSTRTEWGTNDAMKSTSQGGVSPWNASEYLNMWVCNIGGGILGYAQFPGGSASTDGVVMSPQYFGSSDKGNNFFLAAPFDKGRTTTHEIGHFLNLRHIWGDGGCNVDDFVSDTPQSDASNGGCNVGHVSCGSEDMVENYMDYSDDACINLFTQGQKDRMRAVLEAGGIRRSLALSDKFGDVTPPGPVTCSSTISSFPYSESFESNDGWNQASGDDGNWLRDSNGTPSSNTGPSDGADGSFYMFLEASSNSSNGQIGSNATAILESDCLNLSSQSAAIFSFQNHMYGNNVGSLTVQASLDGTTWSTLWTESGNQGDQWNEVSINLSAFLGEDSVRLRFVGTTGNGWSSDIAIDDVSISSSNGGGSDTSAPTTPGNVTASDITTSSATISWSASSDNVGVTAYNVYQGSTLLGSVNSTSASVTGLSESTSYTYAVTAVDAAGNESGSGSVSFTTTGGTTPPANYCASNGNDSSFEWIDFVSFAGISNATGDDGGYADYTSQSATVAPGSTNQLVISAEFASTSYTEYWNIWIDYNQDGVFADSESIASGSSSSANNLSVNVTIPSNATLGSTRMRVSMKYNAAQTACESFQYGEVEDYTIIISNTAKGTESYISDAKALGNETITDLSTYPNPATSAVNVKINTRDTSKASYRLVNIVGQTIKADNLNNTSVDVSELTQGLYILEVFDGQKKLEPTKVIIK